MKTRLVRSSANGEVNNLQAKSSLGSPPQLTPGIEGLDWYVGKSFEMLISEKLKAALHQSLGRRQIGRHQGLTSVKTDKLGPKMLGGFAFGRLRRYRVHVPVRMCSELKLAVSIKQPILELTRPTGNCCAAKRLHMLDAASTEHTKFNVPFISNHDRACFSVG